MKSKTCRARQVHRWLGLVIGVQFVLWTAGGLYFSWTRPDDVHGDHLLKPQALPIGSEDLISPRKILAATGVSEPVDSIASPDLATVAGHPTYRVTYFTRSNGTVHRKRRLADAVTGALREPLTKDEAVAVAKASFAGSAALDDRRKARQSGI